MTAGEKQKRKRIEVMMMESSDSETEAGNSEESSHGNFSKNISVTPAKSSNNSRKQTTIETNAVPKSTRSQPKQARLHTLSSPASLNAGTVSSDNAAKGNPPEVPEGHSSESVEVVSKNKLSKDNDEGFDSEANTSVNDIRYDPYKRGCKRPGLRVRRFVKPWWIQSAAAKSNYGITYVSSSYKQVKAEQELKKTLKKNHTAETKLFTASIEIYLEPSEKLKMYESKKISKKTSDKKKKPKQKTAGRVSASDSTSLAFTGMLQSICDGTTNDLQATAVSCAAYDLSSIGSMTFSDCGNGLHHGAYIENKSDGIIKLIPGGFKSKAKSKSSAVKFLVILGIVEIVVEDETNTIGPMGHISVNPGYSYEIRNTSDQDVLIMFTRFDRVD